MLPAIESVINSMGITPVRSRTDKWRYGGEEIGFQQGVGTPRAGNYGKQTPGAEGNTKRRWAGLPTPAQRITPYVGSYPAALGHDPLKSRAAIARYLNRLENDGAHLPFLDMPVHSQSP